MAPHCSTLAWKIPWTEEPGRLQSMGSLGVGHDWATSLSLSCMGEGNGNPLQCSCLENPRDGGAWLAAVYGTAQSWTQLKWLSSSSSSSSISPQYLIHKSGKFSLQLYHHWVLKITIHKHLGPHLCHSSNFSSGHTLASKLEKNKLEKVLNALICPNNNLRS